MAQFIFGFGTTRTIFEGFLKYSGINAIILRMFYERVIVIRWSRKKTLCVKDGKRGQMVFCCGNLTRSEIVASVVLICEPNLAQTILHKMHPKSDGVPCPGGN